MVGGDKLYRAILFSVAGIASLVVSAWGLFAWLWGGGGHSISEWSFVFLPFMSFPIFLMSLLFRKIATFSSLLILVGTFSALFAASLHERQTSLAVTDLFSRLSALLIGMFWFWILMAIMPICLYFVCLLDIPRTQVEA